MIVGFPIWVVAIDYLLGVVMWTLIGRFAMGIFLSEDSSFFFMKFFVRSTNPVIKLFAILTPSFLVQPVIPIYVAWFFFMFRFYIMPWLLDYTVMGMLSFPLESEFAHSVSRMVGFFAN